MTNDVPSPSDSNPFASIRTRPGALPFCFPAGLSAASLVSKFEETHWRGQIVGPHGSGKSTLLAALLHELQERTIPTLAIALRDGQRRLPAGFLQPASSPDVIVIDGYEQLSFAQRIALRWHCWIRDRGLLITTHSPALFLSTLATLVPNEELMVQLFDRLMDGVQPLVHREDADASFSRHGGNLREVWFDLYDQYERNRRKRVAIESSSSQKLTAKTACRVLPEAGA